MVSECMASSMFANILHVMRLRQAVLMNASVIHSAPQPQHLVIRTSCQGCKWPHDHPLPLPPTVLSVSNVAIFSYYHREIGKIEVLRKTPSCTSFLWWYLCYYVQYIHLLLHTGWQCVPVTYFCLNFLSPNPISYLICKSINNCNM